MKTEEILAKKAEAACQEAIKNAPSRAVILAEGVIKAAVEKSILDLLGIEKTWENYNFKSTAGARSAPLRSEMDKIIDMKARDLLSAMGDIEIETHLSPRQLAGIRKAYKTMYQAELLEQVTELACKAATERALADAAAIVSKQFP